MEYGLIAALLSVVCIAVLSETGERSWKIFITLAYELDQIGTHQALFSVADANQNGFASAAETWAFQENFGECVGPGCPTEIAVNALVADNDPGMDGLDKSEWDTYVVDFQEMFPHQGP